MNERIFICSAEHVNNDNNCTIHSEQDSKAITAAIDNINTIQFIQ